MNQKVIRLYIIGKLYIKIHNLSNNTESEMVINNTISVLLADDQEIFRYSLHEYLQNVPNIKVVGEAENGHAAVQLAQELRPDVIIMDINMPIMDGIEATQIITSKLTGIKVIGHSLVADEIWIERLYKAGASYFLTKNCDFERVVSAINKVVQGEELCIEKTRLESC